MAEPILRRATASVEIEASPEAVFDAWLDPKIASRFMTGGLMTSAEAKIDPREGGAFSILMTDGQRRVPHEGRYVLIERPRRLIFTWISAGTDERLSLVTVRFTPTALGVCVDLEHEGLPGDGAVANHTQGWTSILRKLAATIGTDA